MYFDWIIYRGLNPDLKAAGLLTQRDYENHFRIHCAKDKRVYNIYQAYPDFNYVIYSKLYGDLSHMSKLQLERHWIEYGRNENRTYISENISNNIYPIITFIIPTIGRLTLIKTIKSLYRQTNNNWKCIVVCDGIELHNEIKNVIAQNSNISTITIPKTGTSNNAGYVRNEGIKLVDTDWVGFVDDDDELSPLYVETCINSMNQYNDLKCIIFRMMYHDGGIFPDKESSNFIQDRVGISFCYSMSLVREGLIFQASSVEDFKLLNNIREKGHKILLSNNICYFVRPIVNIELDYVNALKTIENDITKSIIN